MSQKGEWWRRKKQQTQRRQQDDESSRRVPGQYRTRYFNGVFTHFGVLLPDPHQAGELHDCNFFGKGILSRSRPEYSLVARGLVTMGTPSKGSRQKRKERASTKEGAVTRRTLREAAGFHRATIKQPTRTSIFKERRKARREKLRAERAAAAAAAVTAAGAAAANADNAAAGTDAVSASTTEAAGGAVERDVPRVGEKRRKPPAAGGDGGSGDGSDSDDLSDDSGQEDLGDDSSGGDDIDDDEEDDSDDGGGGDHDDGSDEGEGGGSGAAAATATTATTTTTAAADGSSDASKPWRQNFVTEFLQLTLEEAFYLRYVYDCLRVTDVAGGRDGEELGLRSLWQRCCAAQANFAYSYAAYHYYRARGWVPRAGLKYGADLVLYRSGPTRVHAEIAVVVVAIDGATGLPPADSTGRRVDWVFLHGANRVIEHVAKGLVLCHVIRPPAATAAALAAGPECLASLRVEEFAIRRFLPERARDSVAAAAPHRIVEKGPPKRPRPSEVAAAGSVGGDEAAASAESGAMAE